MAIDGMLKELLVAATRHSAFDRSVARDMPAWLHKVRQKLHDEFPRAPTIPSLAEEAGVHASHLARTFRRHFHCTPGEYIARLRIERACQLLASTDMSLSHIALTVGFSDQPHFTRRFKAMMQTTPAQYRATIVYPYDIPYQASF